MTYQMVNKSGGQREGERERECEWVRGFWSSCCCILQNLTFKFLGFCSGAVYVSWDTAQTTQWHSTLSQYNGDTMHRHTFCQKSHILAIQTCFLSCIISNTLLYKVYMWMFRGVYWNIFLVLMLHTGVHYYIIHNMFRSGACHKGILGVGCCVGGIAALITLSNRWKWGVSVMRSPLCPKEEASRTHWMRHWVDVRACLDALEKRKICPCQKSNHYALVTIWTTLSQLLIHYLCCQYEAGTKQASVSPLVYQSVNQKRLTTTRTLKFHYKVWVWAIINYIRMGKICALLGYYGVSCGNCLLPFWDSVSVPSSRIKKSKKTLEGGIDMQSQNFRKQLPHDDAYYPRRAQISSTLQQKPEMNIRMSSSSKYWSTVKPSYNDISLYDTSSIASDILWCQLIPQC
jgi:hypothetical protein